MNDFENSSTPIDWDFVEYGKYFVNEGASEYYDLAFTEGMKELAFTSEDKQISSTFRRILSFSENTPFAKKKGVSVAFLPASPDTFIFAHIQRRRENELSSHNQAINVKAMMQRPFNQFRFTHIKKEDLFKLFRLGYSPYYEFLVQGCINQKNLPNLKDYHAVEGLQKINHDIALANQQSSFLYAMLLSIPEVQDSTLSHIKVITDKLLRSNEKKQLLVICDGLDVMKKLKLTEAIQYLVYWKLGWLSFALDDVSDRLTPFKLQFINSEDEKYFINHFDSERVYINDSNTGLLFDKTRGIIEECISYIEQMKRGRGRVDQLWSHLNYKLMEELPLLQDHRICFAFNSIDLRKEAVSIKSLKYLITNVNVNNSYHDYLIRIANNIQEEYKKLDGDIVLQWWDILRNSPEFLVGRRIIEFYEYVKNIENAGEKLIKRMLVESSEIKPQQTSAEFKFWKNRLSEQHIEDPALRYIVNRVDISPTILSYWDVAIELSSGNQDITPRLFALLISIALEGFQQNQRNRNNFSVVDIKMLFRSEQKVKFYNDLLNKIILFGLYPSDLLDVLLKDPKDRLASELIKDIMTNSRWSKYWQGYKISADTDKLYKKLELFPEIVHIAKRELPVTESGQLEINPITKPNADKRTKESLEGQTFFTTSIESEIEKHFSHYLFQVLTNLEIDTRGKTPLHYETLVNSANHKDFLIEFIKISLTNSTFLPTLLIRSSKPQASKEIIFLTSQTLEHIFTELIKILQDESLLDDENFVRVHINIYASMLSLYKLSLKGETPQPTIVYCFLAYFLPCLHFIAQLLINKLTSKNFPEIASLLLDRTAITFFYRSFSFNKRQIRIIKEKHFEWLLSKVYSSYISLLKRSKTESNPSFRKLINDVDNISRLPTFRKITNVEPSLFTGNDYGSSYIFFILALHYANSRHWNISESDRDYYIKYIRHLNIDLFEIKFQPKDKSNKVDRSVLGCLAELIAFIILILLLTFLRQ